MSEANSPVLERKAKTVISPPPRMYNVVVRNNRDTEQLFVVNMLKSVFNMSAETATVKMLEVHNHGRTNIGPFIRDIAERKKDQCMDYARASTNIRNKVLETTIEPV